MGIYSIVKLKFTCLVYTVKPVYSDMHWGELLCRNRQGIGLYSGKQIELGQMRIKIKIG